MAIQAEFGQSYLADLNVSECHTCHAQVCHDSVLEVLSCQQ